ncbi:MAG: TetR-like C-terminal domain-containing protein [Bacillota bacterium]|jgi:AcrR family transcriptional regulator
MSQLTKKAIRAALLETLSTHSMDDITVKIVAEQAGISRQTLYNYYYCLMDVVEDIFRDELETSIAGRDTYLSWVEGFRGVLEYFHSRRTLFLHVYRSSCREELMRIIERKERDLVSRGIEQCAADHGFVVSDRDREFMLDLYTDVFMGVLGRCFRDGLDIDPDYIAGRCGVMMDHSIRDTLRRLESAADNK